MKHSPFVVVAGLMMWALVAGIQKEGNASMPANEASTKHEANTEENRTTMNISISVRANGKTVVFELNDSTAAKALYEQLPLSIAVENYGNNEKIFYPPEKLNTINTPLAERCRVGTLAYYAPWGNVVMFYGSFGSASGLYVLGEAISGSEHIKGLSGTIAIEKATNK